VVASTTLRPVAQSLHEPLEAPAVKETVEELYERISARFPERGLRGVCGDLITLVDEVQISAGQGQRQIRMVRIASRVVMGAVLVVTVWALLFAVHDAVFGDDVNSSIDVLGVAETAISDLVYAAIAIFFLWSFPERLQRSRLLNLLHQLRSTAHVIDMHQLTKDPEQLRPTFKPTSASKPLGMTRDEVERYLDYCSEMLSLVGKTAALCAEESRDNVILETVSTIETLTVGLSRKIWQKISNLPPPD
jgi:molybdopterin converting factor small subunit